MTEDQTQPTVVIALVGALMMLVGFLVFGYIAIGATAAVIVLWAGFALGPGRSAIALLWALAAAALVYGVLALGNAVLDENSGEASPEAASSLKRARSDLRDERKALSGARKRESDAQRDAAAVRGKLRTAKREAIRLRRDTRVLRQALRRLAGNR